MVDKQDLLCSDCRKTLRIPAKYWGKKVHCPQCSAVLSVPSAPPAPVPSRVRPPPAPEPELDDVEFLDDEDPYADLPPMTSAAPRPRKSSPRKSKKPKKSVAEGGSAFGLEKRMLNAGVLGGMGLMAGAVLWFVLGLMADRIFFYPPIMFIIGVVSVVKGFISSE